MPHSLHQESPGGALSAQTAPVRPHTHAHSSAQTSALLQHQIPTHLLVPDNPTSPSCCTAQPLRRESMQQHLQSPQTPVPPSPPNSRACRLRGRAFPPPGEGSAASLDESKHGVGVGDAERGAFGAADPALPLPGAADAFKERAAGCGPHVQPHSLSSPIVELALSPPKYHRWFYALESTSKCSHACWVSAAER